MTYRPWPHHPLDVDPQPAPAPPSTAPRCRELPRTPRKGDIMHQVTITSLNLTAPRVMYALRDHHPSATVTLHVRPEDQRIQLTVTEHGEPLAAMWRVANGVTEVQWSDTLAPALRDSWGITRALEDQSLLRTKSLRLDWIHSGPERDVSYEAAGRIVVFTDHGRAVYRGCDDGAALRALTAHGMEVER